MVKNALQRIAKDEDEREVIRKLIIRGPDFFATMCFECQR